MEIVGDLHTTMDAIKTYIQAKENILITIIFITSLKEVFPYYVPKEEIWNADFLKPISPFNPTQGS